MNRPGLQVQRRRGIDLVGPDGARVRRRRAHRSRPDLLFDVLEDRSLLLTLDIASGALTYVADAGFQSTLTVSIDPTDTANVIFSDPAQTIVLGAGASGAGWSQVDANDVTGPLASFSSVAISGATNLGQKLTLDYSSGDPLPAAGLTFDPTAAAGKASNTLTLQSGAGGTTFTSETYAPSGAGAGTISYSDATNSNVPIAFTNLSPINDTVASPTFIFTAAGAATTVTVNTGPVVGTDQTDQINDGGTSMFELINFANKTAVTVNVPAASATTTLNIPAVATGLSSLNVFSGAGGENVNVQAIPAGITVNVDTGSVSGSTTNVGLGGSLAAINSPVLVMSTGGTNTLDINDSAEASAQTYTIAGSQVMASSMPSPALIDFSGGGITTLDLTSAGLGDTFNFTGPVQSAVTTYNFSADSGAGPNTLNVTSSVATVDFATAGVLGFGAGNPVINYTNFQTINVTKPASSPAGTGVTITGTQGQALNNIVVATFTEDDLGNAPADFTATIDWGDSTTSPGTIQANGPNSYNVLGSHTYAAGGTFTVNVTLTDNGSTGTTTVVGTTINVTSTGPVPSTPNPIVSSANITAFPLTAQGATVAGKEGVPLSAGNGVLVGTFMDTGTPGVPTDYAATIDWGDGTTSAATQITSQGTPNGVVFSVFGNHTYAEEGTYPVNVTITKTASGATAIASGQAVIGDAALTGTPPTPATLTASTGVALPAASIIGSFTDANTAAPAGDFTATIDWGDGAANSIGTVVAGTTAGSFNVEATHKYAKPGTYTPSIVVHDDGGSTVTLATPNTASIAVTDAAVTGSTKNFTAVEGINTGMFVLATYTDPNTLATVANESASLAAGGWGDGTPASATGPGSLVVQQIGVTPLTAATNPGAPIFEVLGSHTYMKEFPSTAPAALSVVITTLGGTTTTLTSAAGSGVTVVDALLTSSNGTTITGIEGSATASPTGQTGSLLGTFTDSNPSATVTDFTAAPGSLVVNWGDGTATTTPTITAVTAAGTTDGVVFRLNESHTYAEAGTYSYTVTVTDASGASTITSGSAVIADAALTASATQPTVSTKEAAVFPIPQFGTPVFDNKPVASFTDGNTAATVSDFTAMIDWGDGTPMTAGTVAAGTTAGTFIVSGSHTYADSGVNGGSGTYPIQVFIQDVDGSRLTVTNTATVADNPIVLTGKLNPASDSGESNTDDITDVTQPDFFGTSEPYSHVSLFATLAGGSATPIGQVQAGSDGAWNIVSDVPLADGSYTITATAVDQFGVTKTATTTPVTIVSNLEIDTAGPKVTSLQFNRLNGQIVVTFQDFGGPNNAGVGLNLASIADANNYQLVTAHHPRVGRFRVNTITVSPGTFSGTQTATLSINGGHYIRGGWYDFTIFSLSPSNTSGVRNIAGDALDGEFYGYFPSGNNVPGGNFVAQLTAFHHKTFPPSTLVGRGTPVHPPGTRQGSVVNPRTVNPSKFPKFPAFPDPPHTSRAGSARLVHDRAAKRVHQSVGLVHHSGPAIAHPIQQGAGPMIATAATASPSQVTAMGALTVLDQALDQAGTSKDKKHQS